MRIRKENYMTDVTLDETWKCLARQSHELHLLNPVQVCSLQCIARKLIVANGHIFDGQRLEDSPCLRQGQPCGWVCRIG